MLPVEINFATSLVFVEPPVLALPPVVAPAVLVVLLVLVPPEFVEPSVTFVAVAVVTRVAVAKSTTPPAPTFAVSVSKSERAPQAADSKIEPTRYKFR